METGKKEVFAAVVLAAGRGKRMESSVHKQYLLLHEKPVLYYALKAFEESRYRRSYWWSAKVRSNTAKKKS